MRYLLEVFFALGNSTQSGRRRSVWAALSECSGSTTQIQIVWASSNSDIAAIIAAFPVNGPGYLRIFGAEFHRYLGEMRGAVCRNTCKTQLQGFRRCFGSDAKQISNRCWRGSASGKRFKQPAKISQTDIKNISVETGGSDWDAKVLQQLSNRSQTYVGEAGLWGTISKDLKQISTRSRTDLEQISNISRLKPELLAGMPKSSTRCQIELKQMARSPWVH